MSDRAYARPRVAEGFWTRVFQRSRPRTLGRLSRASRCLRDLVLRFCVAGSALPRLSGPEDEESYARILSLRRGEAVERLELPRKFQDASALRDAVGELKGSLRELCCSALAVGAGLVRQLYFCRELQRLWLYAPAAWAFPFPELRERAERWRASGVSPEGVGEAREQRRISAQAAYRAAINAWGAVSALSATGSLRVLRSEAPLLEFYASTPAGGRRGSGASPDTLFSGMAPLSVESLATCCRLPGPGCTRLGLGAAAFQNLRELDITFTSGITGGLIMLGNGQIAQKPEVLGSLAGVRIEHPGLESLVIRSAGGVLACPDIRCPRLRTLLLSPETLEPARAREQSSVQAHSGEVGFFGLAESTEPEGGDASSLRSWGPGRAAEARGGWVAGGKIPQRFPVVLSSAQLVDLLRFHNASIERLEVWYAGAFTADQCADLSILPRLAALRLEHFQPQAEVVTLSAPGHLGSSPLLLSAPATRPELTDPASGCSPLLLGYLAHLCPRLEELAITGISDYCEDKHLACFFMNCPRLRSLDVFGRPECVGADFLIGTRSLMPSTPDPGCRGRVYPENSTGTLRCRCSEEIQKPLSQPHNLALRALRLSHIEITDRTLMRMYQMDAAATLEVLWLEGLPNVTTLGLSLLINGASIDPFFLSRRDAQSLTGQTPEEAGESGDRRGKFARALRQVTIEASKASSPRVSQCLEGLEAPGDVRLASQESEPEPRTFRVPMGADAAGEQMVHPALAAASLDAGFDERLSHGEVRGRSSQATRLSREYLDELCARNARKFRAAGRPRRLEGPRRPLAALQILGGLHIASPEGRNAGSCSGEGMAGNRDGSGGYSRDFSEGSSDESASDSSDESASGSPPEPKRAQAGLVSIPPGGALAGFAELSQPGDSEPPGVSRALSCSCDVRELLSGPCSVSWYAEPRGRPGSVSNLTAYVGPCFPSDGGRMRVLGVNETVQAARKAWGVGAGRLCFQFANPLSRDRRKCLTDAGRGFSAEEDVCGDSSASPRIFTRSVSTTSFRVFPGLASEAWPGIDGSAHGTLPGGGQSGPPADSPIVGDQVGSGGSGGVRSPTGPGREASGKLSRRCGQTSSGLVRDPGKSGRSEDLPYHVSSTSAASASSAVYGGSLGSGRPAGPELIGQGSVGAEPALPPPRVSRTNVSAIPTLGIQGYPGASNGYAGRAFSDAGLSGGEARADSGGECAAGSGGTPEGVPELPEMASIDLPAHMRCVFQSATSPLGGAADPGAVVPINPRASHGSHGVRDAWTPRKRVEAEREMDEFRQQLALYEENIRARAAEDRSYEFPRIPQPEYLQDLPPKGSTVLRKLSIINCKRVRGGIVGVIVLCPSSRLLAVQIKGIELCAAQVCAILHAHPACLALGLERPSFEGDELDAAWQYAAMLHEESAEARTEMLRAWPVFPPELEPAYPRWRPEASPVMSLECSIQFELGVNRSASYLSL